MPVRDSILGAVNALLRDDPAYRKMTFDAIAILDRGPSLTTEFKYGVRKTIPFLDLYCQTPYNQIVRFEELVIIALAWQDVLYGDLIYRFLPTDAPPLTDHDLPGNNRISKA